MAYNRKMRKFEGTCYIPGEQLAMMAKYYRGANLNLNLTLFEDDLATMQETLDQACWCSKLDELDRMKMSHMKGNEWRIQHDHCLEEAQQGPSGRNPKVYPALPQSSRSTVGKVERGTSAVSLYDRERGMVRSGRYQRDDYSEPHIRRDDYYDRRNRRDEFNDPRNRRGHYSDPRNNVREDYDMRYRRDDYPGPPAFHAQVLQNEKRTGRNTGGPTDRRYDMDSEAAMSSLPEVPTEIRCAVCNVETCLVCKNHLYSPICQCKCPVANAGLCNKCSQEPCEEEEQVVQEAEGNKMDMSSMMFTMMMSSMFKQSQAPETVCCCKPSRDNSESSSSDSSDGKIHKVYLYDCEDPKNNKKSKKKSKKASSESSSACDCCTCSRKPKKNSGKKEKGSKSSGEETTDSDAGQKRQSAKGKGSKDSNRKSKGGDGNSDIDANPKGSKDSNRKPSVENRRSNKSSKEDDAKSVKSENMKSLKMTDGNMTSMRATKVKTRGSKAQGSIDSKNVQFSSNNNNSPRKSQELSSSESDVPKRSPSPQKSPPTLKPDAQMCELLDTQHNVPDLESSNHTKKDGDADGVGEESSTTFSLKEFIVCLPKIQSNLQSLMYKLNQMDRLNNQLQYPPIDPSTMANAQLRLGEMQTSHDVPLISSPQNPLSNTAGSICNEYPQLCNKFQRHDSEISIGYSPGNLPVQNLPPTISPGSSKDEPKVQKPLHLPARYHSIINFPNLGDSPESIRTTAGEWEQVPRVTGLAESTKQTQSYFKFSPLGGGAQEKDIIGKSGNRWPLKDGNHTAHSPSLIFPNIDRDFPQPCLESEQTTIKMYCKKRPGEILQYQKGDRVNEKDVNPMFNAFYPSGFHNVEITELPECKSRSQGNNNSRKSTRKVHETGTAAATSSRYDGETIFQSYNRESSAETSDQDLTDYASFTDEKHFQLSPATSVPQANYQRKNKSEDKINVDTSSGEAKIYQKHGQHNHSIISKCSRNKCEGRTLDGTRAVLKATKGVTFKAKKRNPLSLEKLVQGCTMRGSTVSQGSRRNNANLEEKADSRVKHKMKLLDQGVGPGKFRRSKSDSSLDLLSGNTLKNNLAPSILSKAPKTPNERNNTQSVTPTSVGKRHEVSPLVKKRSVSPIKEKAKYTVTTKKNSILPKRKGPLVVGKCDFKTLPSDRTKDQSVSILKTPDAYIRQEIDSKSYIVSSVEVKTINNHGSSTDILKMVQGIASNSVMNVSSVPQQTAPMSSDGCDIVPLLPLSSTTPADGPGSRSDNQSGTIVKNQVFFDDEASSNTPAFLRKSRVQVEQLKRAHETIRSMIRNVNDVIAHIDSDSKIGIKSKAQSEDKERQSYFVHLGDDDKERHCKPQDRRNYPHHSERQAKPGTFTKPAYSSDRQNREVQEMFLSVNRVIDSVLTPSEQSSVTEEAQGPSENTAPTRAHRDFFILNSESSSTAFTESLRRSLENDTSRSVPLATQQVPPPQRGISQRPQSTRPLKRRSWFPPPKK